MKSIINLGDSITISLYPDLDATERYGKDYKGLGAGDLLYKNNDEVFPELAGLDLSTYYPNSKHFNLAADGAIISSVYNQIKKSWKLVDPKDVDLVTLTVGGNDLLQAFSRASTPETMYDSFFQIEQDYSLLVSFLKLTYPNAKLLLNSVYDPTDGTGMLPGRTDKLPLEALDAFNLAVLDNATEVKAVFVDLHDTFMGYGMKTMYPNGKKLESKNGYYWHHSIIEPNLFGASAIRMAWLDEIEV